eukprot:11188928-Lingulodinium_polyedra.AAC.1
MVLGASACQHKTRPERSASYALSHAALAAGSGSPHTRSTWTSTACPRAPNSSWKAVTNPEGPPQGPSRTRISGSPASDPAGP